MTRDELLELFDEVVAQARATLERKNSDYAETDDALANLTDVAARLGLTAGQVWAVYFDKHVRTLEAAAARGRTLRGEALEERATDAINFCVLAVALHREGRRE